MGGNIKQKIGWCKQLKKQNNGKPIHLIHFAALRGFYPIRDNLCQKSV